MKRSDFTFDLPPELIAQRPSAARSASRLLALDGGTGALRDGAFADLPSLLRPGDLLVLNDTRVVPARTHAVKDTGGRVEVMLERVLGETRILAQLRASKPVRPGLALTLDGGVRAEVVSREGSLSELELAVPAAAYFEAHGHMPLPPYIERTDDLADRERYQTVYAERPGAVAAPTAGLHFDDVMLDALAAQGVRQARVTLHVGAGTFTPVRTDDVRDHVMHREYAEISAETCAAIRQTRAAGGRVVAVGTTAVRTLESAASDDSAAVLEPFAGDTQLFIYPGFRFRVVDAMITNFHLSESTLLMLVCAFAGREPVLDAYRHAVEQRYRFFSYGDAMFLTAARGATAGRAAT